MPKRWSEPLRIRLCALALRPEREAEIIAELSLHLDERYEELCREGICDADAERLVLEELDSTDALVREMRGLRQTKTREAPARAGDSKVVEVWREVSCAARGLRRQPGFTATAIVILALGIGAAASMFSLINSVLLKPLSYPNGDALVRISHAIGGSDQPYFNDQLALTYEDNTRTLQDIGVWLPASTVSVTGRGTPEEVRSLTTNRGLLTTLGVEPAIGRLFSAEEDTIGGPDIVMLSYAYWQRAFGGDPRVLDRTLVVNSAPRRIIGVTPATFHFEGTPDVILPLRINRSRPAPFFRLLGVARLRPGVTLDQANADAARILSLWLTESGQTEPAFRARYQPALRSLKEDVIGKVRSMLWVLMGTVGVLLLMACANVANLLLVRADARRQEFAVRAALGESATRRACSVLVESLMLTSVAGIVGVGLAVGTVRLLRTVGPVNLPRLSEISIDATVLAAALAVSVISGLLLGLLPMVRHGRPGLITALGRTGRGATLGPSRLRSQHALVTLQIALALVLLVGAGLMIRSFQALIQVEPGFIKPEQVQTFNISIPPAVESDAFRLTRLQQSIIDSVAALPGVESVAFTTRLPLDFTDRWSAALAVEGRPDDGLTPPNRQVKMVSPGTFHTLGTALVAGRDFTWVDLYDARDVAIVSENLAREYWGSPTAALGKRVRQYYAPPTSPWLEVIGVAANVHDDGLHREPPDTIYWPARLGTPGYPPRRVSFVVRSDRAGTDVFVGELHGAVWKVNQGLPLAQLGTLEAVYDASLAQASFTLLMLGLAGAVALLLGVVGVYGLIAFVVEQRRREIGIRLALGAHPGQIHRLFLCRSALLAGVGIALGVVAAFAFSRWIRTLLFDVEPLDPLVYLATPLFLLVATLVASYVPARRALTVNPVETMRAE